MGVGLACIDGKRLVQSGGWNQVLRAGSGCARLCDCLALGW